MVSVNFDELNLKRPEKNGENYFIENEKYVLIENVFTFI